MTDSVDPRHSGLYEAGRGGISELRIDHGPGYRVYYPRAVLGRRPQVAQRSLHCHNIATRRDQAGGVEVPQVAEADADGEQPLAWFALADLSCHVLAEDGDQLLGQVDDTL